MKQAAKVVLRTRIIPLRKLQSQCFEPLTSLPHMIRTIASLMPGPRTPGVLGGYYPVKGEFNILPILEHFAALRWTVSLPITGPKFTPLEFLVWQEMDSSKLSKGKYNIPVPSGPRVYPNVLLVPLVGFTESCGRLGYGGGYYDKTIRQLKAMNKLEKAIGIAYEVQKCDMIPFEDNDEPLDAIVTEKKAYCSLDYL
eukprot:TRINITY_DN890_c0_g1_i3.p1 TRINITY_DN890_c0_g1~~TRINITY_DN890_c0_g1_i3.p1  ORF type:complete len:197 (-),score=70.24 TRINITY_DN890_c0_g1_i3:177-767(-)